MARWLKLTELLACQHCGAVRKRWSTGADASIRWVQFECRTIVYATGNEVRTPRCEQRQESLDRARARDSLRRIPGVKW